MIIKRYNPNNQSKSKKAFYIQSHGMNAGKPLKNPIPNSWEIETEINNAFEICFAVFSSKMLLNFIRGSVIPFIALHEYKKIIKPFLIEQIKDANTIKKLSAIQKIDIALDNLEQKKKLYKEYKTIIANDVLKTIKKPLN